MELDKEKMLEDMTKALMETDREETSMSFISSKDEASFFPEQIEGWELIGRSSRLVPQHFVNDGRYRKVGAGVTEIKLEEV